ncbi:hypothetical protein GIB67_019610 [Kingdonia uniflora]|uniref:BHLH domain-containing protein n=1 Tax=Kingdonia uniflora TaxID=39325 RepID=A0A7J7N0X4_9MAGN|nr:hypothetical protein GIB67_019610 [Kingdonia uniflora]
MAKDCSSWFHDQSSQFPSLNCTNAVCDMGQQNVCLSYFHMVSANKGFAVSDLPTFNTGQDNGRNSWIYGCRDGAPIHEVTEAFRRRFLVFNHSGTLTNLIFNSVIESPIRYLNAGNLKPPNICGSHDEVTSKRDWTSEAGPNVCNGLDQNQEIAEGSEMHEDTEELNALIYSDDDDGCDDEETSTAHSPSKVTECKNQKEELEKVASLMGKTKRKRLLGEEEEEEEESVMDTASSVKPNGSWDYENDAELCRVKDGAQLKKRLKIRETMSILQSIIPSGMESKDNVLVLDEAIRYLIFLKLKANSLGITS